jgi:Zn-dependent M28 family amino/carboxypeptidase
MMRLALIIVIAAVLQTAPPSPPKPTGGVENARRLASATSNEARFAALTDMLNSRTLPFVVEPFNIDKPVGREPRTEGRNIVVTLGEGSPEIVVGAHYDAVRLSDGSLSPGAVDNAASSVILVHLADTLRGAPLTTRVRVVWFDMEELGLRGSAHYVKEHTSDRIAAMLNFDINGFGDTIVFGPSERKDNAALRRTLVETCAAEDIPCVGFPEMPPGDDRMFVKAGVPTISIGTLPALDSHLLWLTMNAGKQSGLAAGMTPPILTTIHTAADTPDRLDEKTMVRTHAFALALVCAIERQ